MDNNKSSDTTIDNSLSNTDTLIKNKPRPSYSSVVSNTHNNSTRLNRNLLQLHHELLKTKKIKNKDDTVKSNGDEISSNKNSLVNDSPNVINNNNILTPTSTPPPDRLEEEKEEKQSREEVQKIKKSSSKSKFIGPMIMTGHDLEINPSCTINHHSNLDEGLSEREEGEEDHLFNSADELISPIEKVKVEDSFINLNPIPPPINTPPSSNNISSSNISSSSSEISSPLTSHLSLEPNHSSKNKSNFHELTSTSDLSSHVRSTIQNELMKIYKDIQPTKKSNQNRLILLEKIQNIFENEFPGKPIKANLFGSSVNGLETVYCDVDICLTTPSKEENYGLDRMDNIATILEKYNMTEIYTVQEAKVPICKFVDPETNLSCDINVNNTIALQNSMMVKTYASIDERAKQLIILIKHYAKRRMINDATGGTLSSYCWVNMVINFLQQRQPPILPCLHELGKEFLEEEKTYIDGVDCSFYHDLNSLKDYGLANKESLADLFYGFFKLYGEDFDYKKHVVSVRKGIYMEKSEKGWDLDSKKTRLRNNYFCVEEPFNPTRNLANSADHSSVSGIRDEFVRALNSLRKDGDVERVFEQYRPFRRPTSPYPFNSSNGYVNLLNSNGVGYGYPMTATGNNNTSPISPVFYTPVILPSPSYPAYNQYAYPVYVIPQATNSFYSYTSGGEEDGHYYVNNGYYTDSNKSYTYGFKNSKYEKNKKKRYNYKKHHKMSSSDFEKEPLSPRYMDNVKNNYFNTYQNNYSNGNNTNNTNNNNNANGYERFPNNGKVNYSMTSPKVTPSKPPTVSIPYSYTSPVLSPTSSFSSIYSMSSSSIPPYNNNNNNNCISTLFNKPLNDNENTNENNNDNVKETLSETVNEDFDNVLEDNVKEQDKIAHSPSNENETLSHTTTQENETLTQMSSNHNDDATKKYKNKLNDSTKATSNIPNSNINTNGNSDNHLLRIPITNNLIFSYPTPMLGQYNNILSQGDASAAAANESNSDYSSNSHYMNNSFSSSVGTSEIEEDFRKLHFLSYSPHLSGHQADTELNDSGKDNSFSSTSKDFLLSLMNRSISPEIKTTTTQKDTESVNANTSRKYSNPENGFTKEKLEEQIVKVKDRVRRRKYSTASSTLSDNDKLNIITGTSLTSPTVSILSPSPMKPSDKVKFNSTAKPIPSGFDSIKYPSILNLYNKMYGENEEIDSMSLSSLSDIEYTLNPEDSEKKSTASHQNKESKVPETIEEREEKEEVEKVDTTNSKSTHTSKDTKDSDEKKTEKKAKKGKEGKIGRKSTKNTDILLKSITALLKNPESTTVSDDSVTSTSTATENNTKRRGRTKKRSDSVLSADSNRSRAASVVSNVSTTSTTRSSKKKEKKSAGNEKKAVEVDTTETKEATSEAPATPKRTRKSQTKKARESIRELSKTAFEKPRTVNDILSIFKSANNSKKEEPVKKEPMSYAKMLSKNIQRPQNTSVEIEHKLLKVPPKEEKNL